MSTEELLHSLAKFQTVILESGQTTSVLQRSVKALKEELEDTRCRLAETQRALEHSRREFVRMNTLEQESSEQLRILLKTTKPKTKGKKCQ